MIIEQAVLDISEGREAEFEAAFTESGQAIIAAAAGCRWIELTRGIERSATYVLLVAWESVEAHTVGFRESPQFADWRAAVGPFFAGPPQVLHLRPLSGALPS